MTHEFVPFEPEHIQRLHVQPDQHAQWLAAKDLESWDLVDGVTVMRNGEPIALGGVTDAGHFWGLLAGNLGRSMLYVHSCAEDLLDHCGHNEVETYIRKDFPNAIRWAEMLGFMREGSIYEYLGKTYERYLRHD